jgi:glutamate dehydrogenase (NAD(P)+)
MPKINTSPLDVAIEQIDNVAKILELEPGITEILKKTRRTLSVLIPLERDNNKIEVFTGFRVQHTH